MSPESNHSPRKHSSTVRSPEEEPKPKIQQSKIISTKGKTIIAIGALVLVALIILLATVL